MTKSSNKRSSNLDAFDPTSQPGPDNSTVDSTTRKKTKTSDTQLSTRRSSRANKGNGGQIVQMRNIERVQTQTAARVMPMDVATANEPLNPLAPTGEKESLNRRTGLAKGSAGNRLAPSETPMLAYAPPPRPVWQNSQPGSCYGFNLPPPDSNPATSVDMVVPSARGASLTSTTRRSPQVTAPSRCPVSTTPVTREHFTAPMSRGGSVAPVSRDQLSIRPTSPVLLRSSQIRHRTQSQRSPSRTNSTMQASAPAPPLYDRHDSGDMEPDDDRDGIPLHRAASRASGEYNVPIDELSPDEDDRVAEAALRASGTPVQAATVFHEHNDFSRGQEFEHYDGGEDDGDVDDSVIDPVLLAESQRQQGEDVVRAYHQRNGFPRAPPPEQLRAIRGQQQPVAAANTENSVVAGSPSPDVSLTLIAANGKLDGLPTKLRSYPFGFRQVIERAKLIALCDCATKDPFPARPAFLESSAEIFNEALVGCENVPPGYWPNYCAPLGVLLWDSLMTWRSTIKSKARDVLPRLYNVGPHRSAEDNQSLSRSLIHEAMFLRDGVDEQGSTRNMAHPGLADLVKGFFYSTSSLNSVFPEVFSREAPKVAVCLAATALRAALDEYSQTGTRQDRLFEFGTYSKIFAGYLDMQRQIDQSPKHAAKTKELRIEWASAGSIAAQSHGVIARSTEFRVVLD